MRPAFEALNVVHFYDKLVQNSANELVELAVADAIVGIVENKMLSKETKDIITETLNSTKLWVMFPDDILNLTKIEGMYSELDFEGNKSFSNSDSLIELTWNILKHNRKLNLKRRDTWIKKLQSLVKYNDPIYFFEADILSKRER